MPRLLLLRHAKSSWDDHRLADINRPLAPRGHRAAQLIAEAIEERGFRPDRILCSPALRTRETLAALVAHLGEEDIEIEITHALYEPHSGDYRGVIAEQGDAAGTLLVIGHNPAIQATAVQLADGRRYPDRRRNRGEIPDRGARRPRFPGAGLVEASGRVRAVWWRSSRRRPWPREQREHDADD